MILRSCDCAIGGIRVFKKLIEWKERQAPKTRRLMNVVLVITIAVLSAYILLKYLIPYVLTLVSPAVFKTSEAIASIGIVVTISVTAINLISSSMKKRYASKKQLSLNVSVNKEKVIITSTIENTGSNRITPKTFYLFINAGVRKQKADAAYEYEFPNILKHQCNEFDCALAKRCKVARIEKIPDELLEERFKSSLSICSVLNHIAADSVNFIDPGEIYSEDMIFELPPGVYRVILVGISVEADCMCAHRIFCIE